jgi:hypothetical protein
MGDRSSWRDRSHAGSRGRWRAKDPALPNARFAAFSECLRRRQRATTVPFLSGWNSSKNV